MIEQGFTLFCEQLFSQYFSLVSKPDFDYYIDLIVEDYSGIQYCVQVKTSTTSQFSIKNLKKSIENMRFNNPNRKIILVIGTPLDEYRKTQLEEDEKVIILSASNLVYLAEGDERLLKYWRSFYSEALFNINDIESISPNSSIFVKHNYEGPVLLDIEKERANQLIDELIAIPEGNEVSTAPKDYELKCEQILRFLFDGNLVGWQRQSKTDDDLNIMDLVCRISTGNEFWDFIKNEFNSRYIMFEFKNYSDLIRQTQIYTTEKYLFQKALRNVCFIVSRKGIHTNSQIAVDGILRESGKLIIPLLDNDLIKMLELKAKKLFPEDYLFDKVDNYLMRLSK